MADEKHPQSYRGIDCDSGENKKDIDQESKIAELLCMHIISSISDGLHFPVALEGALKLKEISYIHAEGYSATMNMGLSRFIDAEMPVVVIATHNAMYEKIMSSIQEIKAGVIAFSRSQKEIR